MALPVLAFFDFAIWMVDMERYCYHCGRSHPEEEMRLIQTKGGARWRCIKSIEATKKSAAERDAFGKMVTAANAALSSRKMKVRAS